MNIGSSTHCPNTNQSVLVSEMRNNLSLFLSWVICAILACCVLLYGLVVTCKWKYLP